MDMATLELIDFSLEDDRLLSSTSPPDNQSLDVVLPSSPKSVSETKNRLRAAGQQSSSHSADSKEAAEGTHSQTAKSHPGNDAVKSDIALSSSLGNAQSGIRLLQTEASESVPRRDKDSKASENIAGREGSVAMATIATPPLASNVTWGDSTATSRELKHPDGSAGSHKDQTHKRMEDTSYRRPDEEAGSQLVGSTLPSVPARRTRSARAMSSLRKSLAWDKAFSTDEGVLDPDELPLVAKTPKKLPVLPPLDIPELILKVSPVASRTTVYSTETLKSVLYADVSVPLKPPTIDKSAQLPNISNVPKLSPGLLRVESFPSHIDENAATTDTATHLKVRDLSDVVAPSQEAIKLHSGNPGRAPVNLVAEALEKGTRLKLPNSFTSRKVEKKEKLEEPPKQDPGIKPQKDTLLRCKSASALIKPPSPTSSLSKKVSSVSKKMKDTIGRVLPGSMGRSSTNRKALAESSHADRLRPVGGSSQTPSSSTSSLSSSSSNSSTISTSKVPGSPALSFLSRSKSARSALPDNSEVTSKISKTGVLSEVSNRSGSNSTTGKPPPVPGKRNKGEGIWGSLRGRGTSSGKGIENSGHNSVVSSPRSSKKTIVTDEGPALTHASNQDDSHSGTFDNAPRNSNRSGLRLPSPKLGFFDSARPSAGPEKSSVLDGLPRQGLPPRPTQIGSTSGRMAYPPTDSSLAAAVRGYVSSGIPSAPHLRPSDRLGKRIVPSASAPASPLKNSDLLSPASRQAVTGRYLTSRSNAARAVLGGAGSSEPRKEGAVRKLTLGSSDNVGESARRARSADAEAAVVHSFSETVGIESPTLRKSWDASGVDVPSEVSSSLSPSTTQASGSLHMTKPGAMERPVWNDSEDLAKSSDAMAEEQPIEAVAAASVLCSGVQDLGLGTPKRSTEDTLISREDSQALLAVAQELSSPYHESSSGASGGGVVDIFCGTEFPAAVGSLSSSEIMSNVLDSFANSSSPQLTVEPAICDKPKRPDMAVCTRGEESFAPGGSPSGPQVEAASRVDGKVECEKKIVDDQALDFRHLEPDRGILNCPTEKCADHSSNSVKRNHERRKSIFGWQDMHATFSSPTPDVADEAANPPSFVCTPSSKPPAERSLEEDFLSVEQVHDAGEDSGKNSKTATDELQAEIIPQRTTVEDKPSTSTGTGKCSAESKAEDLTKSSQVKTPEKQRIHSKIEDFFESPSHWSGWPVLEAANQSARRANVVREDSSSASVSRRCSSGRVDPPEWNADIRSRKSTSPMTDGEAAANESPSGRFPLGVNWGILNASEPRTSITPPLKKERNSLLAFARSAVSRLTSSSSSSSDNSPGQENSKVADGGSGSFRKNRKAKSVSIQKVEHSEGVDAVGTPSPFSEERIRALEAAVQESILMKKSSGAVQHSPPNKPQPPPNPWSPVRRNGQQLGPFDCTKCTNAIALN